MYQSLDNIRNSKIRHFLMPIRSKEFPKFIPMTMLMFTILLNQNIVRILKDSITVTLVGPEVISFTKFWGEVPIGLCFIVLYTKMCNMMTTEQAFRVVVMGFLIFFAIFGFVLFPNSAYFHPDPALVQHYMTEYPHEKWFILIWGNWTYILFYIVGEMWPMTVFCLLFWQLANKITKIDEAPRFYSFFNLFGQMNLLFSGMIITYFQTDNHCFAYLLQGSSPSDLMLKSLILVVICTGMILLSLHYYIEKVVMSDERYFYTEKRNEILKLSTRESIRMVIGSRYLGLICLLMLSYGMSINLIEGLWLSKVKSQYPTANEFMGYQGTVLFWVGIFSVGFSLIGSSIIRYLGWTVAAIITPTMILLAGSAFFICVIADDRIHGIISALGFASPLAFMTFAGGMQNVLGKGTKYSLFDATKEMAYIPLDSEMKTKGKAAVDIIGNKIGKSFAAMIQFMIFSIFPAATYNSIALLMGTLYVIICIIWIYGVKSLGVEYGKLVEQER